jgi:hypothetical protein
MGFKLSPITTRFCQANTLGGIWVFSGFLVMGLSFGVAFGILGYVLDMHAPTHNISNWSSFAEIIPELV